MTKFKVGDIISHVYTPTNFWEIVEIDDDLYVIKNLENNSTDTVDIPTFEATAIINVFLMKQKTFKEEVKKILE